MYSQAIASASPKVRVMLFVIVFCEKVSTLDCALEIGRWKDTSDEMLLSVYNFIYINTLVIYSRFQIYVIIDKYGVCFKINVVVTISKVTQYFFCVCLREY